MVSAAIVAGPPTFINFLKLNSNPKANNRNTTPISAQVCILAESMTEGVNVTWGLAMNPATIYPNTKGCFNLLNIKVITPAETNIRAKSTIKVGNWDITSFKFAAKVSFFTKNDSRLS